MVKSKENQKGNKRKEGKAGVCACMLVLRFTNDHCIAVIVYIVLFALHKYMYYDFVHV